MRKEENNMAEECITLFNKVVYDMLRKRFTRSWISGAIVGAAAVGFYEVYKRAKKNKTEVKEEN